MPSGSRRPDLTGLLQADLAGNVAPEPGDRLMREDDLYDLIIELDHNDRPRIAGRGSAVFIHVARPGFQPTAGCVALRRQDLLRLLERVGPRTRIVIA